MMMICLMANVPSNSAHGNLHLTLNWHDQIWTYGDYAYPGLFQVEIKVILTPHVAWIFLGDLGPPQGSRCLIAASVKPGIRLLWLGWGSNTPLKKKNLWCVHKRFNAPLRSLITVQLICSV